MAVVPLIRNETVVASLNGFERDGKRILIINLDDAQLRDDDNEPNVTYDLRVGEEFRDHRDRGKRDTGYEGEIVLFPNSAVIIQTLEHVHVPRTRFAYIVPKVSLLQKGISNTSSKVDPGYPGPLLITVFNLGKTTVRLKRGDRFCTIVFHEVADPARTRLYDKEPKRILGAARMSRWQRFRDFTDRNSGTISVIAVVVTLILICVEAGLFHYLVKHTVEQPTTTLSPGRPAK